MSRLLTDPSPDEVEVVRRAQQAAMSGDADWGEVEVALVRQFLAGPQEFIVEGSNPPLSIAYLHALVAKGLGDSYNYADRTFLVEIQPSDRLREPTLKGVDAVTLHYRAHREEVDRHAL